MARAETRRISTNFRTQAIRGTAYRMVGMALGFVSTTALTVAITHGSGSAGFATFTVLVGLLTLMPFIDLGLGSTIVNGVADYRAGRISIAEISAIYRRVQNVMRLMAVLVGAGAVTIEVTGQWATLLGPSAATQDAGHAATLTLLLLAVSIPMLNTSTLLQGAGDFDRLARIALVSPVLQMVIVPIFYVAGADPAYFALIPAVGFLGVATATWHASRSSIRFTRAPFDSRRMLRRLFRVAAPLLVAAIMMSLIFNCQRLVMSHLSTSGEVARFGISSQYLVALFSVVALIAKGLWPEYRIHRGSLTVSAYLRHVGAIAATGLALGLVLSVGLTSMSHYGAFHQVEIDVPLLLSCTVVMVVLSAHMPAGAYLTDERGARQTAVMTTLTAVAVLALSITSAPHFGAVGVYCSMAIGLFLGSTLPAALLVIRDIRSNRSDVEDLGGDDETAGACVQMVD